jgi:glycosyltransferase involved in cell wall biosynthesis
MRIAFLANKFLDPRSPGSWSGLPFFIKRAVEDSGIETQTIWCEESHKAECWIQFLYWRLLHGKRYLRYCNERLLRDYARQIERRLAADPPVDAVFSVSTWPIAFLETDLPVVFWTDACFAGMLDFYGSFSNLAEPSVLAGHAAEQRALDHCTRAIYSSQWVAQTALERYRVDPAKLVVIPFGGNLQEPPSYEQTAVMVSARDMSRCNLLLVGVDWERKGADTAVEAVEALREAGLDARLTVVGCKPPLSRELPSCVEIIPFIGKETAEDRRQLGEIYARSHFFIMPSRAEAFGVVFAEASAFGVPCLAAKVGGLPSVITDDVNGRLFSPGASGKEYADHILKYLRNPVRYRQLALRTAREGTSRLSWNVSGRKVGRVLDDLVHQGTSSAAAARTVETAKF